MKKALLAIGFVCLLCCGLQAQTPAPNKWAKQEDIAENKVIDLPEVKKAFKECLRLSKGKRHLMVYVQSDPTPGDDYFQVAVAEDNGTSYATWMIFHVKAGNYKIYYCDTASGEDIPLAKWRKHPKWYM